MDSINISQILANSVAFLTCASLLGAFFLRYIKVETQKDAKELLDARLKQWIDSDFNPWKSIIHQEIQAVAGLSNRLTSVEVNVKNLTDTVNANADRNSKEITGLGNRIDKALETQNETLFEIIRIVGKK